MIFTSATLGPCSWSRNPCILVVTSPPYWTLKEYRDTEGQLGHVADYETFLGELDDGLEALLSSAGARRTADLRGRRRLPVAAEEQRTPYGHSPSRLDPGALPADRFRQPGPHHLAQDLPTRSYEVENGSSFLGKPYEPNAVIKNDIEFILMERKPGGYRQPSVATRVLSVISEENHRAWFQQIWSGLTGASTRNHPAPYPLELAERLIRMFSFVGDTVLDPFLGHGHDNAGGHAEWPKLDRLRNRQRATSPTPASESRTHRTSSRPAR